MILIPEYLFHDVSRITPNVLHAHGITALVLDVDNTLTGDESQVLAPEVQDWLDTMRAEGVSLTIVSNNKAPRVQPFADRVGLAWVPKACKPLTKGLRIAQERLNVPKEQMAMVGDQIFTDRMAAGLFGIKCFMVQPRTKDVNKAIIVKRYFERPIMWLYFKRGGKVL